MTNRNRSLKLLRGAVLVLALAACGPTTSAPTAQPASTAKAPPAAAAAGDRLQQMIEAARQEGELVLVSTPTTLAHQTLVPRWAQGFNKYYGLDLKVTFTPGPPMTDVATRLVQEYEAGRPAVTDVMVSAALDLDILMEGNAVLTSDWTSWAPNLQRSPQVVAEGGVAVAVTTHTPGITYNTDLVKGDDIPKSLQDLLQPRYKGRIGTTPYAALMDQIAAQELWGYERTRDYLQKFAPQVAGLMGCSAHERIASGEFHLLALDCGTNRHLQLKAQGAHLAQVIPSDIAVTQYFYYSVPKHAAHPNAAQLWVNYALSREAQDLLYEADFSDHHLLEGSKSAARLKEFEAQGIKFHETSIEFVLRNDPKKFPQFTKEFSQILQNAAR
jgi:iron(III) transport system substrate-binding protein